MAQQGGQFDLQQLMQQAQKMQEDLESVQSELAAAEVTGSAGGGLVIATLTGTGELTAISIDAKAVDPDDVETLQDLVVAAVRDAHRAVGEFAARKMSPVTGGIGDTLSGLGALGSGLSGASDPRSSGLSGAGDPRSSGQSGAGGPGLPGQ